MKNISFRKLTTVAAVGWGIIPLHAQDNLTVDGNLIVNQETTLKGDATVEGSLTVVGTINGSSGLNTILSGAGVPAGATGNDGDFYIDTAANTIYGPKTAGSWGTATSLVGSTGPQGPTGADGADGNTVLSGSGAPGAGTGVDGDYYISMLQRTPSTAPRRLDPGAHRFHWLVPPERTDRVCQRAALRRKSSPRSTRPTSTRSGLMLQRDSIQTAPRRLMARGLLTVSYWFNLKVTF